MVQRLALLLGGLGAAGVLAVSLGLGNFVFAGHAADQSQALADVTVADVNPASAPDAGAAPNNSQPDVVVRKVKDKVYVLPPADPPVTRVSKPAKNTQPAATTTKPPKNANANTPSAAPAYSDDEGEHQSAERSHEGQREGSRGGGGDD